MPIKAEDLTHIYMQKTPFEKIALDHVSLDIKDGELIALIGHTGSGKSTLIQHFNGLLKPSSGKLIVDGEDVANKKAPLMEIRKKVGIVFQYPEYQLFEETIAKDIAFGPRSLELPEEEILSRVKEAMEMVGLDYKTFKDKSPFELSGGQKRRVAIAGILAMRPSTLILDEPTAGLDPKGRDDILNQINKLHKGQKMTIIIVSHSMEDVARIAKRVIVMNQGKVILDGTPREVFKEIEILESVNLGVPQVTYMVRELRKRGFDISDNVFTVEEAKQELLRSLCENRVKGGVVK